MPRILIWLIFTAALALAHPMGNFSVNHYARIAVGSERVTLTYILDFAELPTLELMQQWDLTDANAQQLEAKARLEAPRWLSNLALTSGEARLNPRVRTVESQVTEGAAGMPILRIGVEAEITQLQPGILRYKDNNFADRAGWKEVVIRADHGATIAEASNGSYELSRQLTVYPLDPGIVPPQNLEAFVRWTAISAPARPAEPPRPTPQTSVPPTLSRVAPPAGDSFSAAQSSGAGSVQAGDFLSRLLKRTDLSGSLLLLGFAVAFGLGAMHALSPGHGKTIVAAYLVGSRGTTKHAFLLGSMVTLTHTISVFALGLGVLFFQQYVVPEKVIPVLGAISGASIVIIGIILLYRRVLALSGDGKEHAHAHAAVEEMEMAWAGGSADHVHDGTLEFLPSAARSRSTFVQSHTHDGVTHSHVFPAEGEPITPAGLIALGASGGLVPCPSALILMLSSIALGHTLLGLGLLVSFSTGLAVVLVGIGMLVIYANHLFPRDSGLRTHPVFRLLPVFSAVVVIIVGVLMTLTSLGMLQPVRILGG